MKITQSLLLAIAMTCLVALPGHAQLPYGPDTCQSGYVWREAFPGDHVCVNPDRREQAAHDNSQARANVRPAGGPYGPDTCREGLVWREARPMDHVCVTPITRSLTARENGLAPTHRAHGQCASAQDCRQKALALRHRADALRQEADAKRHKLEQVKEEHARRQRQRQEESEKWAREHPGVGRATMEMEVDDITPLSDDIRALDSAERAAEAQAASYDAQAQQFGR